MNFSVDDSGNLHPHSKFNYFVYAGYVFTNKIELDNAKRNYRSLANTISSVRHLEEAKASNLLNYPDDKRKLYAVMKKFESFHVVIDRRNVYDNILENKKSICRYKDYALKRVIKQEVNYLISSGQIDSEKNTKMIINIDEQATASDGYYNLRESIYEELANGIYNFDYGKFHEPLLHGGLDISIEYFDSKKNYMIQASDILANRIWSSYILNRSSWRKISKHNLLTLP